jgi:preprotein translocase subunit SecG
LFAAPNSTTTGATSLLTGTAYAVVALILLIGGVLLRRSSAGRVLAIAGSMISIPLAVISLTDLARNGTVVENIVSVLFSVITIVLAALGPTKRWTEQTRPPALPGEYGAWKTG